MQRPAPAGPASPSRASPLPDVFGRLPFEILLPVLKLAPDFSSLWSLVNASPAASAVFDAAALEVVEAVMVATTPVRTQSLLRTFINAEASGRFPDLAEARQLPRPAIPAWAPPVEQHGEAHPLWPRRFLLTAHRIHTLAHGCIEYYMMATNSLKVRDLDKHGPWVPRFDSTLKELEACVSFPFESTFRWTHSWGEEQRASNSLWFIAFYSQLQRARKTGLLTSWPAEDVATLAATPLVDFDTTYRHPEGRYCQNLYRHEQVVTVLEYLQALPGFGDLEDDPLASVGRPAADRYFDARVCESRSGLEAARSCEGDRDTIRFREVRTKTALFWRTYLWDNPRMPCFRGLPFSEWRRFGFALWDDDRMADLGLWDKTARPMPRQPNPCYRWFSIMGQQRRPRRALVDGDEATLFAGCSVTTTGTALSST